MIRFSQQDPKWKNKQLGNGDCTIGSDGCFLTCFSMLLEVEPPTLNDKMVVHGGFLGSNIMAGVVPVMYPKVWNESITWCKDNPAPLDTIDRALTSGMAVIVQVDTSPAPDIQSHWVIITSKVGNDYNMVDPWPVVDIPRATLLGRYGKGRDAKTIITYILVMGGTSSAVEVTGDTQPAPEVSTVDTITVTTDYINLRREPNTNADNEPIGEVLRGMTFKKAGTPLAGTGKVISWQPVIVYVATGVVENGITEEYTE